MVQFHQIIANSLLLLMFLLAMWGLGAALFRRSVGGSYRSTYILSIGVFGLQAAIGAALLLSGHRPADMLHLIYGIVPFLALVAGYIYSAGMKPRREALTLGLAALFTFGLIIRAFTTGR